MIKEVKDNEILFAKLKGSAIIPSKIDENMAYDVYACFENDRMVIQPQETKLIPTGICSAFNKKWGVSLRERGSNAIFKDSNGKEFSIGMKVSAGQIDSGYRGEWFIAITNTNNMPISIDKNVKKVTVTEDFILYPYSKAACQAKFEEVPVMDVKEISLEELKAIPSMRGDGKIGSSGK